MTSADATATLGGRRAWAVWFVGLVAYAVAVLHRTSFGVVGLEAADRFDVGAALLSTFVVVQLGVYALMQVPSGLLLDRFGSRSMIAAGALVMAAGQGLLAVSDSLPVAYLARVLIGTGDAATFVSLIRLVSFWFPARQVPVLTQLSGILGQVGQVVSALAIVPVLHARGWSTTFVGLAAVGVLAGALAGAAVRDTKESRARRGSTSAAAALVSASRESGTWLGFASHALTQFPLNVFVLLWGFPFLVSEGRSPAQAGAILTVVVVSAVAVGPAAGVLTARFAARRSWIVLCSATASLLAWAVVLLGPEPAPTLSLVILAAVLGLGGPASMVGFDFARTSNPPALVGTATGVVNVGGFAFAVAAVFVIGLTLDSAGGFDHAFRLAMGSQLVFWLLGLALLVGSLRAVERQTTRD